MRSFKCFIDYTKEEKWLNEMAQNGYELTNTTIGYNFNKISPADITYRIDYRTFKTQDDFIDYCTLFEDCGWKHVAGSRTSGNQYFKRISDNSDNDIFSDNASKAARYKRVSNIWLVMALSYFTILISFVNNGAVNMEAFTNPKALYYTPGLWDKTGLDFLTSFLFETPFALGRGFIWLVFPICITIYLYLIFKSSKLYKETLSEKK